METSLLSPLRLALNSSFKLTWLVHSLDLNAVDYRIWTGTCLSHTTDDTSKGWDVDELKQTGGLQNFRLVREA